jgi:hypothetical protein
MMSSFGSGYPAPSPLDEWLLFVLHEQMLHDASNVAGQAQPLQSGLDPFTR